MKLGKKSILSTALVAALGLAGSAQAITFTVPGVETVNGVETFDWSVSNALSVGSTGLNLGDTFQLLSHGSLGNYEDTGGVIAGTQLNAAYEITYVTSFEEIVTFSSPFPGPQSYETTGAGTNFFEIWYDAGQNSNMLAGTGFNDGTLIASGTIQAGGGGGFNLLPPTTTNPPTFVDLDQFGGTDNYVGIDSVTGVGGTAFDVVVNFGFYDTDFFVNGLGPLAINFTTNQNLPFNQTDPSALFAAVAGGVAPAQPGATLGSVGAFNGFTGPNVILQVDASSSLDVQQVPVPAPLALLGLGMLGFGLINSRRKAV